MNTHSKICPSRKVFTRNKANSFQYQRHSNTESKNQLSNYHFLQLRLLHNQFEVIVILSQLVHITQRTVHGGRKSSHVQTMRQWRFHPISKTVIIVRDAFTKNNQIRMMRNLMWVNNEWKWGLSNQSTSSAISCRTTNWSKLRGRVHKTVFDLYISIFLYSQS
jgi:hypothetical protein